MLKKLFGKKAVEVKEEVKPQEVVTEVVKEAVITEEEKKMMDENKMVADEVTGLMMKRIEEAGIDMKDMAAISAYLLTHQEEVKALSEKVRAIRATGFTPHAELNAEMHAEFLKVLESVGMYGDPHIHAVLMSFVGRGEDEKQFTLDVLNVFKRDKKAYGQYFRQASGVKEDDVKLNVVKTTGYVTADTFRSTGDLIEAGVTKTIQAVNKYVFQLTAKGIDKAVGGRPEEMKDYNYVNDAAGRVWEKTKSLTKEKPEQTEEAAK